MKEIKISKREAETLHVEIGRLAASLGASRWNLGEALYRVDITLVDGIPAWAAWGYTSMSNYVQQELAPVCGFEAAMHSMRIYAKFCLESPKMAAQAKTLGFSKLRILLTVRTNHGPLLKKWLDLAAGWNAKELLETTMCANLRNLTEHPERAFDLRNSRKPTATQKANGRTYTGLTQPEINTLDWAEEYARTVLRKNVSPGKAIALVVAQFKRLAQTGRAGVGWNDDRAIEVAAA